MFYLGHPKFDLLKHGYNCTKVQAVYWLKKTAWVAAASLTPHVVAGAGSRGRRERGGQRPVERALRSGAVGSSRRSPGRGPGSALIGWTYTERSDAVTLHSKRVTKQLYTHQPAPIHTQRKIPATEGADISPCAMVWSPTAPDAAQRGTHRTQRGSRQHTHTRRASAEGANNIYGGPPQRGPPTYTVFCATRGRLARVAIALTTSCSALCELSRRKEPCHRCPRKSGSDCRTPRTVLS